VKLRTVVIHTKKMISNTYKSTSITNNKYHTSATVLSDFLNNII